MIASQEPTSFRSKALASLPRPATLRPARRPPENRSETRLLVVDEAARSLSHETIDALGAHLREGDVLIVNDAATLPASLAGQSKWGPVELRLLARGEADDRYAAVLFGRGDWRIPTEHRPAPPRLEAGELIAFEGFSAAVTRVRPESPRLVDLRFDRSGDALFRAIYRAGLPVQYAHVDAPLDLWTVQTPYAARPWAVELPSAGWALGLPLIAAIRRRGVEVAALTHAAGLSATGDPALDAALPLAERYDIPEATVLAVARAKARGGRVIAVGTTVVRALEGSARGGALPIAGEGETTLRIGPSYRPTIASGLVTGMHAKGESHYELLRAFVDDDLLARALQSAAIEGYRCHELGDAMLTLGAPR